jgi:hypothetical protein
VFKFYQKLGKTATETYEMLQQAFGEKALSRSKTSEYAFETVRRKRPHKWSSGTWLLHHDNAPCHAALSVRELLTKHSIPVVPHPPYSPDLAPCDFFLFSRLKSILKG